MDAQDIMAALEAAHAEAGKQVGTLAIEVFDKLGGGHALGTYEEAWSALIVPLLDEIEVVLASSVFSDEGLKAHLKTVAMNAAVVEFNRLTDAWFSEGGHA